MRKSSGPKTTVWRSTDSGDVLVKTIDGLPVGTPQVGSQVNHPDFGIAVCIGTSRSGSGPTSEVTEIKLRIADLGR